MLQEEKSDTQKWKRYEFLFQGTPDMILYISRDGKVCEMNSSAMEELGCSVEDGIWIQDVFRTCVKNDDAGFVLTEKLDENFETTMYRSNQTCFPATIRMSLLSEETGLYCVCRARSAIEKRETDRMLNYAKEEVERAKKERNELVANVTHELRTPVNGIMGIAQNLLETELNAEQKESIEIIDHCCKNMIKIINNILDFSKIEAGKFTLESREFSFHQMMDKIVKLNLAAIEEKGLKLVCNVSPDIPEMMIGDELRITQVLNNLLSNATKFTSVGQIVVNVIRSMDLLEEMELFFMVIDSGIGISDEEKDKLFKSFSQVDASITRKFGGTGLGLSIVKNLVQMMGGDVNVESVKGKGSTFSFSVRVKKVKSSSDNQNETLVGTAPDEHANFSFHVGHAEETESDVGEIFKLGSTENKKEIKENMEKLVLCIEMENWDKADTFANNIKQLVADDAMNLKRKAFRLQMTLRRGDYDTSMEQYEELKEELVQKVYDSDS